MMTTLRKSATNNVYLRGIIFIVLPLFAIINIFRSRTLSIISSQTNNAYNNKTFTFWQLIEPNDGIVPSDFTFLTADVNSMSISSLLFDNVSSFQTISKKPKSNMGHNTKIIGFADHDYEEVAYIWYQELEKLGHKEHFVVGQDKLAIQYFQKQQKRIRYDWIHKYDIQKLLQQQQINDTMNTNFTIFRKEICHEYDRQFPTKQKRNQVYRRTIFGNRWRYILYQLEQGYNVLLTDVDNVFVKYRNMSDFEDSDYDQYLAYAGTVPSFPRNIYYQTGFTVCGGMSWMRSTKPIIELVRAMVNRCGCESTLYCDCYCDDQVQLNNLLFFEEPYKITWDVPFSKPKSEEEMSWEGRTGTNNSTGYRVQIWDRHTAFRRRLDPEICPDERSWVAMPMGPKKTEMYDRWKETCGSVFFTNNFIHKNTTHPTA